MDIIKTITNELNETRTAEGKFLRNLDGSPVRSRQVEAAVKLIDEGNTIPFIARYRKEATGELTDEHLRFLGERLTYLRGLEERKGQVLASIEEQGKLTAELKGKIEAAATLSSVEDLYRPYKPKRKTRASIARAKGLQPLADYLRARNVRKPVLEEAARYVTKSEDLQDPAYPEEKKVLTPEDSLQGAEDILAEMVSDDADVRSWIRKVTWNEGILTSAEKPEKEAKNPAKDTAKGSAAIHGTKEDRRSVYEMYFHFEEKVSRIPGYRVLALNRGEAQKYLTIRIEAPEDRILAHIRAWLRADGQPDPQLEEVSEDAYHRLLAPSIEREIRTLLTERAEDGAITVFKKNLEQLLMQPPITGKTVMGWDPAFRTGCKISVVDPTGKVLDTTVVFPTEPQNKVAETKREIKTLIHQYGVDLIALGNGTASRESEQVIVAIIRELKEEDPKRSVSYVIVNEAGASVYSASSLAAKEFPDYNVGQRSAISMARRLQDPLAELVKIDPKAIGVGQYQHDMDQKKLGEALSGVVEDCVNRVGVDLNTASVSLLEYVSGITEVTARNIVDYRVANGRFRNRQELLKVPRLGPKAFEQCAGFLRIREGEEPLDSTAVHPEDYKAVRLLLEKLGLSDTREDLMKAGSSVSGKDLSRTAAQLGMGEITLKDILVELQKPGRDPREDAPAPVLRSDVLSIDDLKPGMKLKGTVRNIVDFGAFVDIGVHQDGLVHISRLSDHFVRNPLEVVHVGQVVEVMVVSVDLVKKRISLSMNGKM